LDGSSKRARNGWGRYIDGLNDLDYNYNHSVHSSIKESPVNVQFCNTNFLACWNNQYRIYNSLLRKNNSNPIILQPCSVGTNVLIVSYLNPYMSNLERNRLKLDYSKVSTQKWTVEEFQITEVKIDESNPNILRYILKDSNGYILKRKFYHHELQKVYIG